MTTLRPAVAALARAPALYVRFRSLPTSLSKTKCSSYNQFSVNLLSLPIKKSQRTIKTNENKSKRKVQNVSLQWVTAGWRVEAVFTNISPFEYDKHITSISIFFYI